MKKWLKRAAVGALALSVAGVVVSVVAGAAYEALGRMRAARDFPAPGRLVDVGGGRHIQLDCRGTGTPIVVFESGLDSYGSLSWSAVHDAIAATTRACAYSRAGIMWSDAATRPFSSANVAQDLHSALVAADENAPYVMVGHSLGGPYLLAYAARYSDEVAGLVFVDASHPEQVARLRAAAGKQLDEPIGEASFGAAIAWTGLVRVLNLSGPPPTAPVAMGPPVAAWLPTSLAALVQEMRGTDATFAAVVAHHQLGGRPLVVLTHGRKFPPQALQQMQVTAAQVDRIDAAWCALQDDEATWSTHSRHLLVADASHYIQFDQPQAVIDATRDVVAQVRQGAMRPKTLPPRE